MSSPSEITSFVLKDVCIFTGDSFIDLGYVSVLHGVITEVGEGDHVATDPAVPVISRPNHTILPGLIDSHTHALKGNVLAIEQPIRFGVTTVCDMHNEAIHIAKLQELSNNAASKGRYSDFKCAGAGAIVSGGWPEPVVRLHGETPETKAMIESWPKLKHPSEARPFVEQQIAQSGASYIKLFHELGDSLQLPAALARPPLDLQRAVVDAAHECGRIAVGHAFSYAGTMDLLSCGVDGLTHIFLDKPASDDWVGLCKKNSVHVNPTLSTCASQTREGGQTQRAFAADPLAQRMLFDATPRKPLGMAARDAKVENAYESTRKLYRAGVPLIVGSDSSGQERGTAYGLGVHMEMHALLHTCGLDVLDVLRAATSLIADRFGFDDRGRIEEGKKADLLLVEGDVREVLADEGNLCLPVKCVWRDGVVADVWRDALA